MKVDISSGVLSGNVIFRVKNTFSDGTVSPKLTGFEKLEDI